VYATGVPWAVYTGLVELRDEARSGLRITFDQGRIEIVSPKYRHEKPVLRLALIISSLAAEFGLKLVSARTTTLQQEQTERGLEPDDCFYIANAQAILGLEDIDLAIHPPPDIAIEVDVSRSSVSKEAIYASMRVPELWRHDQREVTIRVLNADLSYETSTHSRSFPLAEAKDFVPLLDATRLLDDLDAADHFRAWARRLKSASSVP
jgi:Uma2 family endonuclease